MRPRNLLPLLGAALAMLFAGSRRWARSYAPGAGQAMNWGNAAGPFSGFGKPPKVKHPQAPVGSRHRRPRGPISRLCGFLWGMFWIWFGLSFAFGGGWPRQVVAHVFDAVTGFFTGVSSSASGMMQ